jgi:galactokinase
VNLIGDHTDYTGGLVLPMAIDRWTTVRGVRRPGPVRVRSTSTADPTAYVDAVAAELGAPGFEGEIDTTLPIGAGLSSSAAVEVALALAMGFVGDEVDLARLCQRAEHRATGVPTGIMDQLTVAAAVEGHALLIDCHTLVITPIALPAGAEIVVVHSGQERALVASAYADRAAECAAAEREIGPLRDGTEAAVDAIADPLVRARARHVVTENGRVRSFATALAADDLEAAGALMAASHASLRDDFAVTTPALDDLVGRIGALDGVFGVRMTGAGFGGCVVVLARPGAVREGWIVRPVGRASVELGD